MRKTLILTVIAAIASGGLAGAVSVLPPNPFGHGDPFGHGAPAPPDIRPVWTEVKWPFPIDQWGRGKAFACRAADCGVDLTLFLRAKIGFCNCTTGVADDEELHRVSDLELVGTRYEALGAGQPIAFASMKGRSRPYAIKGSGRSATSAIAIAVNDRCDVVVATAVVSDSRPASWEPAVIGFLNEDRVRHWAEKTLGL